MFSPLKESAYFARQHIQPLLTIALLLTVPVWLIDYALPTPADEDVFGVGTLIAGLVFTGLSVIQFAAAMFYIHQQVQGQPIGALQAIMRGASRIGPLLLINLLMALAIGLGFVLLIFPGLYMAYKLLFSEFFLLFHGQSTVQSLRSSYRTNELLTDKLLPPLLGWLGGVAAAAIGQQLLLQSTGPAVPIEILFEGLNLLLTVWGWALLYRLYQLYIAPAEPLPVAQDGAAPADEAPTQSEPALAQQDPLEQTSSEQTSSEHQSAAESDPDQRN